MRLPGRSRVNFGARTCKGTCRPVHLSQLPIPQPLAFFCPAERWAKVSDIGISASRIRRARPSARSGSHLPQNCWREVELVRFGMGRRMPRQAPSPGLSPANSAGERRIRSRFGRTGAGAPSARPGSHLRQHCWGRLKLVRFGMGRRMPRQAPSPGLSPANSAGERRIRSRFGRTGAGAPSARPGSHLPQNCWREVELVRFAMGGACLGKPPLPASPPQTARERGEFDRASAGLARAPPPLAQARTSPKTAGGGLPVGGFSAFRTPQPPLSS
jgi:hypothetical protein